MHAFQNDLRPLPDRVKFHPLTGFSFDARNASARNDFDSFLAAHIVKKVRNALIFTVDQPRIPINDGYAAAKPAHGLRQFAR
jgi:hypothetical protein